MKRHRGSSVSRDDNRLIVWHNPNQVDGEDIQHIVLAKHIAALHHGCLDAIDYQPRRPLLLSLNQADDTVGIADG